MDKKINSIDGRKHHKDQLLKVWADTIKFAHGQK